MHVTIKTMTYLSVSLFISHLFCTLTLQVDRLLCSKMVISASNYLDYRVILRNFSSAPNVTRRCFIGPKYNVKAH